jgi:hypothetical protein
MEFLRKTRKVGNSAGVILPKSILGSEVKIIVVKRPLNLKKEAIKLLGPFFRDLAGIYIIQENPVEILAISSAIRKVIESGNSKIKISIVPLSMIKRDLKISSVLREKLVRAKTILNRSLLAELRRDIRSQLI